MNVRSGDKKQKILKATMELIAENGLHNTPMSQVSKRSGVSAGAIYSYFKSKEEIINHLYLDLKTEIRDAALENYDINMPYEDRFFLVWHNFLDYLLNNSSKMSFVEQCSTSPLISPEAREEGKRRLAPVQGFVMEGIEAGKFKDIDIELIYSLIYSSIISAAKLHLSGNLTLTDEMKQETARCCWDGLRRRNESE